MAHFHFTEEGLRKIKEEVEELERFIRIDCARDLATAAAHGDLRENAEYAAAKEKQALAMAKLRELRDRVSNARVVRRADLPPDSVALGKRVQIKELASGEVDQYTILGEGESDVARGIISYQTPIARALMGHKKGDVVEISLPAGSRKYEILSVDFLD